MLFAQTMPIHNTKTEAIPDQPESETSPPPAEALRARSIGAVVKEMASELALARELLWQMTLRDLRLRYKQAVMGFAWAIFMPLLVVAAGFVIKSVMARTAGETITTESIASMVVKAIPWGFFVGAVGFATVSLTANLSLVSKIYFPREVLPLSAVLTQAVDTMIGAIGGAIILILLKSLTISAQVLWLIPIISLLVLFTSGISLLLSCGNLYFRDVKYIVQVVLNFGVFFVPVFYESRLLGPSGCPLMMCINPLSPILEGIRLVLIEGHNLFVPIVEQAGGFSPVLTWSPWYLACSAVWSIVSFFLSWFIFHCLEFTYAEYV